MFVFGTSVVMGGALRRGSAEADLYRVRGSYVLPGKLASSAAFTHCQNGIMALLDIENPDIFPSQAHSRRLYASSRMVQAFSSDVFTRWYRGSYNVSFLSYRGRHL